MAPLGGLTRLVNFQVHSNLISRDIEVRELTSLFCFVCVFVYVPDVLQLCKKCIEPLLSENAFQSFVSGDIEVCRPSACLCVLFNTFRNNGGQCFVQSVITSQRSGVRDMCAYQSLDMYVSHFTHRVM